MRWGGRGWAGAPGATSGEEGVTQDPQSQPGADLGQPVNGLDTALPYQGSCLSLLGLLCTLLRAQSLSRISFFATPWTIACQAPLSVGLTWQEYWGGLLLPLPGPLPDLGIELLSPEASTLAGSFFTTVPSGKPTPFLLDRLPNGGSMLPSPLRP